MTHTPTIDSLLFAELPSTKIAYMDRIIAYMESVIEQEKDFKIRHELRKDVKEEREAKELLIKTLNN